MPHLANRVTPSLWPSVPLYFGATILGEKLIDSIAVMDHNRLLGELRFLDVMKPLYLLRDTEKTPEELLNTSVQKAMHQGPNTANQRATLLQLLRIIESSRSGSVFIVENSSLVGHVSLTDILGWIIRTKPRIDVKATDISTKGLVSASSDATLGEVMELMLDRYVRKVVLQEGSRKVSVVSDRGLTNMIFGSRHNRRSFKELFRQSVKGHDTPISSVKGDASMSQVALAVVRTPSRCVILDDHGIITPWDVVIRGLRGLVGTQTARLR